jgi:hypothetical protein
MTRSPTPPAAPPGFRYLAVEEGLEWRVADAGDAWCSRGFCDRPAVAVLMRQAVGSLFGRRWRCCDLPAHLYGRWVEDGKVYAWRLVADETAAKETA